MDYPNIDPSWLDHAKVAIAAFCSGIVRLLFKPEETFLRSIWMLFGCVTCGFYGSPALMHWFQLDNQYEDAVAAFVGFIGMSIAQGVLRAIDDFDIKDWIRFKLGMKNDKA